MKILDVPRSGSQADTTSSRNRFGQYTRTRRAPVQPIGTGRRSVIRAAFGAASSGWSALTDAQRAAWVGYADATPYTDSLGQSIRLTGHQIFVAIATAAVNVGLPQPTVPPVSSSVPDVNALGISAAFAVGSQEFELAAPVPANTYLTVQLSPPMSAGRGFTNRWWQATVVGPAADEIIVTPEYTAQFGAVSVGQRIFYRITPVNQYGVVGVPLVSSALVSV